MIAIWLPYFQFVRFAGHRPFDDGGGDGGSGPSPLPSGPDERPEEDAAFQGGGKGSAPHDGGAGDNKPNGRARHFASTNNDNDNEKNNQPSDGQTPPADAQQEDAGRAAPQQPHEAASEEKAEAGPSMDEEAFKDELTEHLDSMYRLALSLSKNPRDAEDLTQEATLKALNHWRQYKPGTNMRAWLLAIVRNAFINRYRRQRNRPGSVEFDDVEPFLSDTTNNGEGRHLSVRNIDQLSRLGELLDDEVKKALDELSDDFRETFLLAVVEELSYKDIAQILGVPVGTVMSRLFRARKQMQAKLSGYAHEAGWLQPDAPDADAAGGAEGAQTDEAPSEAEESGVIES